VLRIQVAHLPAHLNPIVSDEKWCQRLVQPTIHEPRVEVSPAGETQPRLAESLRFDQGGRMLILELRPGVKFHDGRPLTSADVKFTLENAAERRSPNALL
jgi:peptide/nickel transport system substrate-binding protein